MKIYNTLLRKTTTLVENNISIYLCGPTVYNYIHLGNARAIIIVDLLINLLEYQGKKVIYAQNYTDIDDKIIQKAAKENKTEKEISHFYIQAFEEDMKNLKIRQPDYKLAISDYIPEIIVFIEELIKIKAAYEQDGNVYFSIEKYQKNYGVLANKKIEELEAGFRIEKDLNKKNAYDFALWKKTKMGILFDSPWGKGRPGWHTECAVLVDKFFDSNEISIHAGGIDLLFPHHENERIQYYAKNMIELAKIWMHNGHLNIGNEKMSKSLNNTILVRDFINDYGANVLRYMLYLANYSQPLTINDTLIQLAKAEVTKIIQVLKKLNIFIAENNLNLKLDEIGDYFIKVVKELENNLNAPNVLSLLNEMIKIINTQIRANGIDLVLCADFMNILQLLNFQFELPEITIEIQNYLREWSMLKKERNFETADKIRTILVEKNVL